MAEVFNADEVLEIAEQIERNGARFYRAAADNTKDKDSKDMLNGLAAMEDSHEKTFAAMRDEISGAEKGLAMFDPYGEAAMYLQAFADGQVFDVKVDPSEKLTGKESVSEILQTALGMEKNAILFFLGIQDMVPENMGKSKIDDIVAEEKGHVTMLSRRLQAL